MSASGPSRTTETLTDWIRRRGLDRGRKVRSVERKQGVHASALVAFEDGAALFVKRDSTDGALSLIQREASILQFVTRRQGLGELELVPTVYDYDDHSGTLVTEGLVNFRTLRDHQDSSGLDTPFPIAIGHYLAKCHGVSADSDQQLPFHLAPPVGTYTQITPSDLAYGPGPHFSEYLAIIQPVNDCLREMRANWRPRCLIHGDFKSDNIMVAVDPKAVPLIKFVDWELAGWGDSLWDVGSFIGDCLFNWINSIRGTQQGGLETWIQDADIPFGSVRRAISWFLISYAHVADLLFQPLSPDILQITRYAGLFLLQRGQSALETGGLLYPPVYAALHCGRTLISDPEGSSQILFSELTENRFMGAGDH